MRRSCECGAKALIDDDGDCIVCGKPEVEPMVPVVKPTAMEEQRRRKISEWWASKRAS